MVNVFYEKKYRILKCNVYFSLQDMNFGDESSIVPVIYTHNQ